MGAKPFSVNTSRFDPYKNYRFLVYFGEATSPVAGGVFPIVLTAPGAPGSG